jgi:hypothetical protein
MFPIKYRHNMLSLQRANQNRRSRFLVTQEYRSISSSLPSISCTHCHGCRAYAATDNAATIEPVNSSALTLYQNQPHQPDSRTLHTASRAQA